MTSDFDVRCMFSLIRLAVEGIQYVSRPCVCPVLKVCEHVIFQTACGNFTEFTTELMQLGTNTNSLDFKVKRPKVKGRDETDYGKK